LTLNILEYLENTAVRLGDKLAFSTGEVGMTFGEVQKGAAAIGSYIAKKGIYREPIVIFMDKHPATVTAFFGVIYSGNFYVCIDEKMPDARISSIIENLNPRIAIANEKNMKRAVLLMGDGEVVSYAEAASCEIDRDALCKIREKQIDTDAIYVVFTSGSTGTPKGVVACHRSVIDYTETLTEALGRYPDRYEVHMRLAFLEIDIQYEKPHEERNYSAFRTYAGEAIRIWRALPEDVEDPDIEYLYRTAEEVVGKLWLAGL